MIQTKVTVTDQNLDVWETSSACVSDALRHYYYQYLSSTAEAAEEKIAMLRANESLLKENDKLKKEKVSLLKNKDLADGQVMVLTRSLEALQKDLKDKEILVQDLKQSLERQRKELNDCRAEITSLKMHIEGSRSRWNLVAGEIEHAQSESLESYKEEIKLLQKEIESLKAGKFIVTESVESIDHETKFIETKDEVVDFHENSAVAPPVDMTSGVLETVGAQLLANQTSDDTNDKSDTAPRETLVSCSNDNNGAIESAEHVSKHNGEPVPEDNGLLLKSDSPGTEPVPEKMGLAGVLGSPSKQEQLTETCYSVCLTTSIGGGVTISKQTRTIDRVLEKSVSSKCSAGGSANEAPWYHILMLKWLPLMLCLLVTLGSDQNLNVKYASIDAFGTVAQHFKNDMIVDKIRVQMDAFLEDGSHEATVAIISSTLFPWGITVSILDDLERAVDDGVNTYKAMCRDSCIVPRAAATEIELARKLKEFSFKETGDVYTTKMFQLLLAAYSTISIQDASLFLGMNEDDATNCM
ncbi:unnamed protein product [Camellia sinensis]